MFGKHVTDGCAVGVHRYALWRLNFQLQPRGALFLSVRTWGRKLGVCVQLPSNG